MLELNNSLLSRLGIMRIILGLTSFFSALQTLWPCLLHGSSTGENDGFLRHVQNVSIKCVFKVPVLKCVSWKHELVSWRQHLQLMVLALAQKASQLRADTVAISPAETKVAGQKWGAWLCLREPHIKDQLKTKRPKILSCSADTVSLSTAYIQHKNQMLKYTVYFKVLLGQLVANWQS